MAYNADWVRAIPGLSELGIEPPTAIEVELDWMYAERKNRWDEAEKKAEEAQERKRWNLVVRDGGPFLSGTIKFN